MVPRHHGHSVGLARYFPRMVFVIREQSRHGTFSEFAFSGSGWGTTLELSHTAQSMGLEGLAVGRPFALHRRFLPAGIAFRFFTQRLLSWIHEGSAFVDAVSISR